MVIGWQDPFLENIKFYPIDHCGDLRCKTQAVNSVHLDHLLEKKGRKLGFSRNFRASLDRVQNIFFWGPSRQIQDEKIAQIKILLNKKNDLEQKLKSEVEKIRAVIEG